MEPFLAGIANGTLTFEGKPENENQIARGYLDSGEMYGNGGRKMFPAIQLVPVVRQRRFKIIAAFNYCIMIQMAQDQSHMILPSQCCMGQIWM